MKQQQPNHHSLSEQLLLEPILLELFGLEDSWGRTFGLISTVNGGFLPPLDDKSSRFRPH
ncbi:hypothetical protein [Synechococcus sp. CC9311]|uniref:hypothetical protein n=1 Tax=Synechococcus sp. (strain CC9311) TaxID=64471 RepID=UPI0011D05D4F|nr:hypothetical protein [Synechococcus sp. CC9311]